MGMRAAVDRLGRAAVGLQQRVEARTRGQQVAGVAVLVAAGAGPLGAILGFHLSLAGTLACGAVLVLVAWGLRPFRLDLDLGRRWVWAGAAVAVVLALGAVGWWAASAGRLDGLIYLSGVLAYVVVGRVLTLWRRATWWGPRRGPVLLAAIVATGLVGLVVASVWERPAVLLVSLGAVVLAPVALALLAEDAATTATTATPAGAAGVSCLDRPVARVGAVAAIVAGGLGLVVVGVGWPFALGVSVALVVLVAAIAFDTSHDIVLVVLLVTLLWSLEPQGAGPQPLPTSAGPRRTIVALGDSYMSGEGARSYYAGTNDKVDDRRRNECRRAPTAYPVQVRHRLAATGRRWQLLFLACSGATGKQVTATPQYTGEPLEPWGERQTVDQKGNRIGQSQLDQARAAVASRHLEPEVVLVQLGGNDASFGELGKVCGLPGDCSVVGQRWLDRLPGTRRKVRAAYERIEAVFPAARILVVPYPVPLDEEGCSGSLLQPHEHRFLVGYTRALDRVVEDEARRVGFDYLASGVDVFARHHVRICDVAPSRAAVNEIAASPVASTLLQQVSPRDWFHNAFHPTKVGHHLVAAEVEQWVEAGGGSDPVRSPAPFTVERIMGDAGYQHCAAPRDRPATCRADQWPWAIASTERMLWAVLIPVGLLVGGALVLAIGAMRWWRQLRQVELEPTVPAPPPTAAPIPPDEGAP